MAEINHEFVVRGTEYRPCLVKKRRALFHRWEDRAETVGQSMLKGGPPAGQLWTVFGIVEYEDGTVEEVYPHEIKFIDGKFREYVWRDEDEAD